MTCKYKTTKPSCPKKEKGCKMRGREVCINFAVNCNWGDHKINTEHNTGLDPRDLNKGREGFLVTPIANLT